MDKVGKITKESTSNLGTYSVVKKIFRHSAIRSVYTEEYNGQKDGDEITVLVDNDKYEVVMSDSAMEKTTNTEFVENAKGDVLIAGLGLGMIVLAIQDKTEVKTITVVELSDELIELTTNNLKGSLNSKVTIVHSNIFDYSTDKKFDTIYFDIWNCIGSNKEEMNLLHSKFKNNLTSNGWINSWRYKDNE